MTGRSWRWLPLAATLLAACAAEVAPPEATLELRAGALVSVNGGAAQAELSAWLVRDGEADEPVEARLTLREGRDAQLLGARVTAPARAGEVLVEASYEDAGEALTAQLRLPVTVRREVLVTPVRYGTLARFRDDAEVAGDRSQLTSPPDGAVVPANVAPLELRFDGGAIGDAYRVRVDSPRVRVELFVHRRDAAVPMQAVPDAESWARLLEDAAGGELLVRVDRLTTEGVVRGIERTIVVASDPLFGDVLAWAVQEEPALSALVRLPVDDRPIAPLPDLGQAECTGCHATGGDSLLLVTRDLADTQLWDLRTDEVIASFITDRAIDAAAFAPSGDLIVASSRAWPGSLPPAPSELSWLDLDGRATLVEGLPDAAAASPALSTDALFYVEGGADDPSGTGEPTRLMRAPIVAANPPRVGAPELLVDGASLAGAPESGGTLSRPDVSDDGDLIVFAHGTHSRMTDDVTSAIYAMRPGAAPVRLARGAPPDAQTRAAWPALADGRRPWVVFYAAGAEGRRRLFVTSLDLDALDRAEDPSSPPFELPNQPPDRGLMAPAWSAGTCRAEAAPCRSDAECCGGACAPGADEWSCAAP